jgi:hypothetical protein
MKTMKAESNLTRSLPGIPPAKRGRPASDKSMTNAERQRRYQKNHTVIKSTDRINGTIKAMASEFDLPLSYVTKALLQFALCNRNWRQTGFPLHEMKEGK